MTAIKPSLNCQQHHLRRFCCAPALTSNSILSPINETPHELYSQLRHFLEKPNSQFAQAVTHFNDAVEYCLTPNSYTFSFMIDGFCKLNMVNIAKGIFLRLRKYELTPKVSDYNTLMATLCMESSMEQAIRLFQKLRSADCEPDVISYNIMINATFKAGNMQFTKELLMHMLEKGFNPDGVTFSSLINRFSKLGLLEEAKSVFERMVSCGIKPDIIVYDSLLKGLIAKRETKEIFKLLHQMAGDSVVLDSKITSTILACLYDISEDCNIVDLLPTFSQENSNEPRISCSEFLKKLHKSHPELWSYAA